MRSSSSISPGILKSRETPLKNKRQPYWSPKVHHPQIQAICWGDHQASLCSRVCSATSSFAQLPPVAATCEENTATRDKVGCMAERLSSSTAWCLLLLVRLGGYLPQRLPKAVPSFEDSARWCSCSEDSASCKRGKARERGHRFLGQLVCLEKPHMLSGT